MPAAGGKKCWLSTAIVDSVDRFQTYPKDFPTEEMAEDAAAQMALQALKLKVRSLLISNYIP